LLTKKNSDKLINLYAVCFIANYIWMYCSGLTFSTYNPVFFSNNLDFATNFLLLTNIQNLILSSNVFRIILDVFFFLLPLFLLYVHYFKIQLRLIFAICNSLFNIFYCTLIPIFTCSSIQQFIPWMIIPLVFVYKNEEKFTTIFYSLRWIFLAIFLSAGLWKITTGSIFHAEHFGAILLQQHTQAFIDGNESSFIKFIIAHKTVGHFFYVAAFFAEISFIVGFFTTKYDRLLIIFFSSFIILDYALMEINYCSWLVFIVFLYFTNNSNKKTIVS
jgi:hypothetical protein